MHIQWSNITETGAHFTYFTVPSHRNTWSGLKYLIRNKRKTLTGSKCQVHRVSLVPRTYSVKPRVNTEHQLDGVRDLGILRGLIMFWVLMNINTWTPKKLIYEKWGWLRLSQSFVWTWSIKEEYAEFWRYLKPLHLNLVMVMRLKKERGWGYLRAWDSHG